MVVGRWSLVVHEPGRQLLEVMLLCRITQSVGGIREIGMCRDERKLLAIPFRLACGPAICSQLAAQILAALEEVFSSKGVEIGVDHDSFEQVARRLRQLGGADDISDDFDLRGAKTEVRQGFPNYTRARGFVAGVAFHKAQIVVHRGCPQQQKSLSPHAFMRGKALDRRQNIIARVLQGVIAKIGRELTLQSLQGIR